MMSHAQKEKTICINSVFPLLLSMIIFRMSRVFMSEEDSTLPNSCFVDTRKKIDVADSDLPQLN